MKINVTDKNLTFTMIYCTKIILLQMQIDDENLGIILLAEFINNVVTNIVFVVLKHPYLIKQIGM